MLYNSEILDDIIKWCVNNFGDPARKNFSYLGEIRLDKKWDSIWTPLINVMAKDIYESWNKVAIYREYIMSNTGHHYKFSFVNKEDAVLFKLTWG